MLIVQKGRTAYHVRDLQYKSVQGCSASREGVREDSRLDLKVYKFLLKSGKDIVARRAKAISPRQGSFCVESSNKPS